MKRKTAKPDSQAPCLALLVKLGSIAVHADELLSPHGHEFDRIALRDCLADPEVKAWIAAMGVYLPLKRVSP